ncbi:MAG: hypothetical protein L6428_03635 [Candidatus Aminicenantes bacterium]|nr:hypothetical protein [Candidatus Aminicenantes bacterium]
MKPLPFILLLLLLPLTAVPAQVTMSASSQTATIAEHIDLRLVVRTDGAIDSIDIKVTDGAYEIIGRSKRPMLKAPGVTTFEEIITIAFFKTGEFNVGPFAVELLPQRGDPEHEQTGQLTIRIRSLLSESDRDIKPLKELLVMRGNPRHLLKYAAGFVLLLLLGVLLWFLLKKMQQKRLAETAPLLAPEIELEMRIRELRQKNLPQLGEFRQFFISLSDMIKHFIERAYEFNAADFTTVETVEQLKNSEKDGEILVHMETLFRQADLVKFARQVPEKETVDVVFQMIAALIKKHKNRRETAMAEAHVQTGR